MKTTEHNSILGAIPKEGLEGRAPKILLLVWHRLWIYNLQSSQIIFYNCCYTKRRIGEANQVSFPAPHFATNLWKFRQISPHSLTFLWKLKRVHEVCHTATRCSVKEKGQFKLTWEVHQISFEILLQFEFAVCSAVFSPAVYGPTGTKLGGKVGDRCGKDLRSLVSMAIGNNLKIAFFKANCKINYKLENPRWAMLKRKPILISVYAVDQWLYDWSSALYRQEMD